MTPCSSSSGHARGKICNGISIIQSAPEGVHVSHRYTMAPWPDCETTCGKKIWSRRQALHKLQVNTGDVLPRVLSLDAKFNLQLVGLCERMEGRQSTACFIFPQKKHPLPRLGAPLEQ